LQRAAIAAATAKCVIGASKDQVYNIQSVCDWGLDDFQGRAGEKLSNANRMHLMMIYVRHGSLDFCSVPSPYLAEMCLLTTMSIHAGKTYYSRTLLACAAQLMFIACTEKRSTIYEALPG
jgi:hypothetical protein